MNVEVLTDDDDEEENDEQQQQQQQKKQKSNEEREGTKILKQMKKNLKRFLKFISEDEEKVEKKMKNKEDEQANLYIRNVLKSIPYILENSDNIKIRLHVHDSTSLQGIISSFSKEVGNLLNLKGGERTLTTIPKNLTKDVMEKLTFLTLQTFTVLIKKIKAEQNDITIMENRVSILTFLSIVNELYYLISNAFVFPSLDSSSSSSSPIEKKTTIKGTILQMLKDLKNNVFSILVISSDTLFPKKGDKESVQSLLKRYDFGLGMLDNNENVLLFKHFSTELSLLLMEVYPDHVINTLNKNGKVLKSLQQLIDSLYTIQKILKQVETNGDSSSSLISSKLEKGKGKKIGGKWKKKGKRKHKRKSNGGENEGNDNDNDDDDDEEPLFVPELDPYTIEELIIDLPTEEEEKQDFQSSFDAIKRSSEELGGGGSIITIEEGESSVAEAILVLNSMFGKMAKKKESKKEKEEALKKLEKIKNPSPADNLLKRILKEEGGGDIESIKIIRKMFIRDTVYQRLLFEEGTKVILPWLERFVLNFGIEIVKKNPSFIGRTGLRFVVRHILFPRYTLMKTIYGTTFEQSVKNAISFSIILPEFNRLFLKLINKTLFRKFQFQEKTLKKLSLGCSIVSYGLLSVYLKTTGPNQNNTIFDVIASPTWMLWVGVEIFSKLTKLQILTWLEIRFKSTFVARTIWTFFDFIRNLMMDPNKQNNDSTRFYDHLLTKLGTHFSFLDILYTMKHFPSFFFVRLPLFLLRQTSTLVFGFFFNKLLKVALFGGIGLGTLYYFVPDQFKAPVRYLITQSVKMIPIASFTPSGFFSGLKSTLGIFLSISSSFFEIVYGSGGGNIGKRMIEKRRRRFIGTSSVNCSPGGIICCPDGQLSNEITGKCKIIGKGTIFSIQEYILKQVISQWTHKLPKERFWDIVLKNGKPPSIYFNNSQGGGFARWNKEDLKGQYINEETLRDREISHGSHKDFLSVRFPGKLSKPIIAVTALITGSIKHFSLERGKELEAECHFPHANDVTIAIVKLLEHGRITLDEAKLLYTPWIAKKLPKKYSYLSGQAINIRKFYYNQYYKMIEEKNKKIQIQPYNKESFIRKIEDLLYGRTVVYQKEKLFKDKKNDFIGDKGMSVLYGDTKKLSKKQVRYQHAPKEQDANCGNCKYFESTTGTCKIVEGKIEGHDYCFAYNGEFGPSFQVAMRSKTIVPKVKTKVGFLKIIQDPYTKIHYSVPFKEERHAPR